MNNTKDNKSDSSDNLDIVDLDFSDELSGEASDGFVELEDISDGKELPFDDIIDEDISSADLTEEIKDIQMEDDEAIIELSDVIKDEKSTALNKSSNMDKISDIVQEDEEDDSDIIELVDKVDKEDIASISLEKETLQVEEKEKLSKQDGLIEKESLTLEEPLILASENVNVEDKPLSSEKEPLLSSEDQIVALLEKVIEDRYGEQLDALFGKVVENILNKQIDNIKKRILTALQ